VVVDAVERARSDGADEVRPEHLLAAVLSEPSTRPLVGQAGGGDGAEAILAEVRQAHRRGGLSGVDVDVLAGLGIDIDEVVGRVEAALGEGALDDRRRPRSRRLAPLSPEVGLVMQAAGRLAAARGDRQLAAHHLLLGLLTRPGLVADTLGRRGVTMASVLAVLDAGRSRARGGGDPGE
jgi:ATP-dependent Clp protease ATP-binding subunit ClpA